MNSKNQHAAGAVSYLINDSDEIWLSVRREIIPVFSLVFLIYLFSF